MKMKMVAPVVSGVALALAAAFSGSALAADAPAQNEFAYDSLTWNGITLYGTVDVGYTYQSHGANYNRDWSQGTYYLISKGSNNSFSGWTNNGLSQSAIGLKGDIPLNDDISGVFKLDVGFNPLSLNLADGPASLVSNGKTTSLWTSANGDSGRAGQVFNGAAYLGASSKTYGTLTWGRQNGLMADGVVKYDPNGGSNAFSLVGFSGTAQGIGNTQDTRLDSSLKYFNQFGNYRVGAQYQFSGKQDALFNSDGQSGSATELQLGGDYGDFSLDFVYGQKNGAIAVKAYSATPGVDQLAGTMSDNTAYALMGSYKWGPAKLFGGYERIHYVNASSSLPNGTDYLGDYVMTTVVNNAYVNAKNLDIYWTGVKYAFNPRLDLSAAYYGYRQNSYGATSCSDASASTCSGTENVFSLAAVYKLIKHVDLYGGAAWSEVKDGMANGYLSLPAGATKTSNTMLIVGARVAF